MTMPNRAPVARASVLLLRSTHCPIRLRACRSYFRRRLLCGHPSLCLGAVRRNGCSAHWRSSIRGQLCVPASVLTVLRYTSSSPNPRSACLRRLTTRAPAVFLFVHSLQDCSCGDYNHIDRLPTSCRRAASTSSSLRRPRVLARAGHPRPACDQPSTLAAKVLLLPAPPSIDHYPDRHSHVRDTTSYEHPAHTTPRARVSQSLRPLHDASLSRDSVGTEHEGDLQTMMAVITQRKAAPMPPGGRQDKIHTSTATTAAVAAINHGLIARFTDRPLPPRLRLIPSSRKRRIHKLRQLSDTAYPRRYTIPKVHTYVCVGSVRHSRSFA
jgi:hypothetical protein